MSKLEELIDKINTLEEAEMHLWKRNDAQVSDVQDASLNLCSHIYNEIYSYYNAIGLNSAFPQQIKPSTPFNSELFKLLKLHAYYAFYLNAKKDPNEHNNLNNYLMKLEQNGFTNVRLVEFYNDLSATIKNAKAADELVHIYKQARITIQQNFKLDSSKGRFLDLSMIIQIVQLARNETGTNYEKVARGFFRKIEAALKMFEKTLEDKTARAEFDSLFTSGVVDSVSSVNDFVAQVKLILKPKPENNLLSTGQMQAKNPK